jgi:hypothetical protein
MLTCGQIDTCLVFISSQENLYMKRHQTSKEHLVSPKCSAYQMKLWLVNWKPSMTSEILDKPHLISFLFGQSSYKWSTDSLQDAFVKRTSLNCGHMHNLCMGIPIVLLYQECAILYLIPEDTSILVEPLLNHGHQSYCLIEHHISSKQKN